MLSKIIALLIQVWLIYTWNSKYPFVNPIIKLTLTTYYILSFLKIATSWTLLLYVTIPLALYIIIDNRKGNAYLYEWITVTVLISTLMQLTL